LIVQGTGLQLPDNRPFQGSILAEFDDLTVAVGRIAHFLEGYRKRLG